MAEKLCPKCKHQHLYQFADYDYCNGCKTDFTKDGQIIQRQ